MRIIATVLTVAFVFSACNEQSPSRPEAAGEVRQPFVLEQRLPDIYERAVRDFAEYEMTHRKPEWPRRTFRLDHAGDSLFVYGDSDSHDIDIGPEMFRGVDCVTALGDQLLNADEEFAARPDNPVRTITVKALAFSEARGRVQMSLGWTDTISESWTFLYEISDDGSLSLRESTMLGCNVPEGWIDGQF